MSARVHEELIPVPRSAVRFPLELPLPAGFSAEDPATWPDVDGELELVGGKLYYMPPTADRQQDTAADVVTVLGAWRKTHPQFVVAGNEAGMILGGEARGADAAIWRRAEVGEYLGRYRRTPPVLAVEIAGELDEEHALRDKARWYLERGVSVVWLLFPAERRLVVVTETGDATLMPGDTIATHPELPGLAPHVGDLFAQVSGR